MKKIRRTIVIIILFLIANVFSLASDVTVENIAKESRTPKEISLWLKDNITYLSDREYYKRDYWQRPEETIELGHGDCDDYAILTQAILKELGIKSNLLVIAFDDLDYGHMICFWKKDGKYVFMSIHWLTEFQCSSLQEALSKHYPDWNYAWIITPNKVVLKRIRRKKLHNKIRRKK